MAGSSNWGPGSPARMPKSQNLQSPWRLDETVVEIVANAREVQATYAAERDVPGARADLRLQGDQRTRPFKLRANGAGRLGSIVAPSDLRSPHLRGGEDADLDREALVHSRLRRSSRSSFIGMVSPRSHCAMASRSMRSVFGSASKVSSPSRASTVTDAPSGNAVSNSTRPSTTFPVAITMTTKMTSTQRPVNRQDLRTNSDLGDERRAKARLL